MFLRSPHRTTFLAASVALSLIACADRRRPAPAERQKLELSLDRLPAEASALIRIDLARLTKSVLVVRAAKAIAARDAVSADRLNDFFARCGIEVAKDLGELVIVLGPPGPQQDAALVVKGSFEEPKLLACIGEVKDEERHGVLVHRTADETTPVWFAVPAPGQVIAATSIAWLDQFLDPAAARLAPTAPLMVLVGDEAKRGAMAWGAGLLPAGVGERIVALTEGDVTRPAQAVSFRLDADTGLRLRIALDMATEGDADKLVAFADDQRGWLAIVAGKYGVEDLVRQFVMSRPEGTRQAVLEARVEPALVEQVAALLGRAEFR
jgi:hypothetical protein